METHPAPAGSQTLPCDRCYPQSIPRSQRQSWGLSSYPSATLSFPTAHPFPIPSCPESQGGSQVPVPPQELLWGLLCRLPQRCSWCTRCPPRQSTSLPEERFWQGSCIKSQLRLGCGFNTFPFIPPPRPQVNTKHLPKPEPLSCRCRRCQGSTRGASSAWPVPHASPAGCWAARNPLPAPAFDGQSQFGYDPPVRTTGPEPRRAERVFGMTQRQRSPCHVPVPPTPTPAPLPGPASLRLTGCLPPASPVLEDAHPLLGAGVLLGGHSPLHDDEQALPALVQVLVDVHDADDVRAL